jgi:hypothetical protein
MKPEDLLADYSELTEWELKVLDDWVAYYTKVRLLILIDVTPTLSMRRGVVPLVVNKWC